MILEKASFEAIKYACTKYHYAKSVPVGAVGYSVFSGGEVKNEAFCGVIVFARGANMLIGSPFGLKQGQVIELARVALNGKQESTSQAIAIALRLIKKDVPLARLVVSYADADMGHIGTVYQATNWYYIGKTNEGESRGFIIKGKKRHKKSLYSLGMRTLDDVRKRLDPNAQEFITRGKFKYIYPLDKRVIQLCKDLSKEYPKKQTI